ncbi:MAG: transcription-repair coupling factor [Fusobacteria bacterium]|nr:transcription-repair coupling factor [Fusobacteriota bacterium]
MNNKLLEKLYARKIYQEIGEGLEQGHRKLGITGIDLSDEVFFYQGLYKKIKKPLLIIKEQQEGQKLYSQLKPYLGDKTAYLPKRNILPYKTLIASKEVKYQRLEILKKLLEGKIEVLITDEESFLEKYQEKNIFLKETITLKANQEYEQNQLLEKLIKLGYQKVDILENRGQFTLRGDVLDLFLATEKEPVRLDFFGDELETIKYFEIEEYKLLDEVKEIAVYPNSDIIPPPDIKVVANKLAEANNLGENLLTEIELMKEGIYQEENERFFAFFQDSLVDLRNWFKIKPQVIFNNYKDIKIRSDIYFNTLIKDHQQGEQEGLIHPCQKDDYFSPRQFENIEQEEALLYTSLFSSFEENYDQNYLYEKELINPYYGDVDALKKEIDLFIDTGFQVFIFLNNKDKIKGLKEKLAGSNVTFIEGFLEESFRAKDIKTVLIGEKDIFGFYKKGEAKKKKKKLGSFVDIKAGDYVVHEEYGIAYYKGIEQKVILGVPKDYLILEFSGTGKLFVPVEKMDSIEKYIGGEGRKPKLSNLSNNEWRKTKEKVRISVSEIAKDLLKLYSARKLAKGFAYSKDGSWHADFADRFPYLETEDQEKAIIDVRKDMEKPGAMDRVVIGDVGYGKTEVALRASFKAVMDSKQTAVLSPTTVLSQQHYRTFIERYKGLPFKIGLLNRFVSKKEQHKTLEELKSGKIDILIGTHRILSKDVEFKDLGLLVIDEEQKFGVVHKEKIKNLKNNIDCLVLSATPIPRTLHMALAGARDLSIIETPPKDRKPVETYVLEHDDRIIRRSILKEKERGGQVFYVYNRVQSMIQKKKELERLIPEVRVDFAHGQMDEKSLEKVMLGFLEGEIDVLLCTTIIENGLNIKNANTLIVEDADNLGLSQIYQLKGRVGRSERNAYAYFMFDKKKILSETANKKLKAIRELTELGSGFKIAMLDLEIRGAGNLLGKEQHGHMLSVGFDLYCKILEEEVKKLESDSDEAVAETVALDLNVDGYIPSAYIDSEVLKIEIYKKLADVENKEDLLKLIEEVTLRFGPVPEVLENLFLLANIRVLAKACNLKGIKKEGGAFIIALRDGYYSLEVLQKLRNRFKGKVSFGDGSIILRVESKLYLLEHFLKELSSFIVN